MSPDPNTSAKHHDTNGSRIAIRIDGVYTTFCQEGILVQKYRDKSGEVYREVLFKRIGVRGRFDSPDFVFYVRARHFELSCVATTSRPLSKTQPWRFLPLHLRSQQEGIWGRKSPEEGWGGQRGKEKRMRTEKWPVLWLLDFTDFKARHFLAFLGVLSSFPRFCGFSMKSKSLPLGAYPGKVEESRKGQGNHEMDNLILCSFPVLCHPHQRSWNVLSREPSGDRRLQDPVSTRFPT